jgi:hypothetical protein
MAARMEKTRTPGVYKRGGRYTVTWRDAGGKPRKQSIGTYDQARDLKRKLDQQARDGEEHVPVREQATLAAYALDLFGASLNREPGVKPDPGRYQGRRGAVRDATRSDYRRDLERYWLPTLGPKRLPAITAPMIARVLAELAAGNGDDYLADRTLKRLFAPLAALMATAVQEGVTRTNPARDVTVPAGRDALRRFGEDSDDSDDPEPGKAKALTSEQVAAILLVVDARWRLPPIGGQSRAVTRPALLCPPRRREAAPGSTRLRRRSRRRRHRRRRRAREPCSGPGQCVPQCV